MNSAPKEYEEYAAVISALPDLVFVLTESGRYAAVFGGSDSGLYHDSIALKEMTLFSELPEHDAHWFLDRIIETLEADKLMIFEYSLTADNVKSVDIDSGPSGIQWFEGRVNPLKSLRYGERAVVWVARNITKRHHLETQLTYHSTIDSLSNIYNRRKLLEYLEIEFINRHTNIEGVALLLVDVDNFKRINDTFGHPVGDNAIRTIANACQSVINDADIIGRLGGDEFGIMHKKTSPTSHQVLAQQLIESVSQLLVNDTLTNFRLSISIGMSHFKNDDTSIEALYNRVDEALYQCKKRGKNGYAEK
jgi:diguanylate cyclase (GGDEF)-like protein